MKPLKLEWFKSIPCPSGATFRGHPCRHYYTGRHGADSALATSRAEAKRFTDAELAAECWRAECVAMTLRRTGSDIYVQRADIWQRFATHPHYDQETP